MRVLDGENMRDVIMKFIQDIVDGAVEHCIPEDHTQEQWDMGELRRLLTPLIPIDNVELEEGRKYTRNQLKQELKEKAVKLYESKEAEFPEIEMIREHERNTLLKCIDTKWMQHIDDMEQLRQGIGLQSYGQKDPLVEYKMAGFDMFDDMTASIQEDTIRILYHTRLVAAPEREQVAKITGTNKDDTLVKAPKRRSDKKIYPNDPCPCGSGKKYKNCCGRK